MNFFSPMALFFGLAALPIIAFYFLKVRQRKVTVPTLLFWNKVFQEKAPQSLFQKLRHPLSLLAQLLLLLLLVLALADPTFSSTADGARKTILILDNSASMRAPEGGSTRLARAKKEALSLVDGLRYFDTMAIIAASGEPQIISGLTDRQATLRQRVSDITPTDNPTRLSPAIDLARTLLAGEKNPAIVLISDGCFDSALLNQPDIQFIPVTPQQQGTAPGSAARSNPNAGITRFQARRSLADPISYDIFIQIDSFDPNPINCTLELSLDGNLIDVYPLSLNSQKPWQQTLTKSSTSGAATPGRLTARLIHPDALSTDNQAFAVVPPARRTLVDLSHAQSFFLRKAFESIPLVDIAPPGNTRAPDLTVLYKTLPNPLPPGPLLIIDPQSDTELFTLQKPLANPALQTAPDQTASPLLTNVQWDGIYLPQAQKLTPKGSVTPLVTTLAPESDPILFSALGTDGSKALVFAGAIDTGDFPLRTAFPILLANSVNYFQGLTGEFTPAHPTGQSLTLPRPITTNTQANPTLTDPQGKTHPLALTPQSIITPSLTQTGFWLLTQNNQTTPIPVNLCDARESNLTPATPTTQPAQTSSQKLTSGAPLWFYLLAAGLTLLALEWYLYQRRWIT